MQTIETKHLAPTNTKGSRFSAVSSDGLRMIVARHYALNATDNHARAAIALIKRYWPDDKCYEKLAMGDSKRGYIFIPCGPTPNDADMVDRDDPHLTRPE